MRPIRMGVSSWMRAAFEAINVTTGSARPVGGDQVA